MREARRGAWPGEVGRARRVPTDCCPGAEPGGDGQPAPGGGGGARARARVRIHDHGHGQVRVRDRAVGGAGGDPRHGAEYSFPVRTTTSIRANWGKPSDGGTALKGYGILLWPETRSKPGYGEATTIGVTQTHSFTGLQHDTEHSFLVHACNGTDSCGYWSYPAKEKKTLKAPNPHRPHTIMFRDKAAESVRVTWSHAAYTGGVPLTRFQIQRWEYDSANPTLQAGLATIEVDSGTARSKTLRNLSASTEYAMKMRACNGWKESHCSPWSADHRSTTLAGTTTPTPTPTPPEDPRPQNLDLTPEPPERVRRALLTWSHLDGAQGYIVEVRPVGEASTNWETVRGKIEEFGAGPESRRGLQLNLSKLMSGGLGARSAYELQLQAVMGKDDQDNDILSPPSDPIILIDTPIRSVNGDSRDRELQDDGQAALRWTPIEKILGDGYGGGEYTFLHRVAVDSDNLHHSNLEWRPTDFIGEKTTDPVSGTATTITGLLKEQIYAIQLRYEVTIGAKTVKVFAARDAFVWPSLRPAGDGERVATFPLNYPLRML